MPMAGHMPVCFSYFFLGDVYKQEDNTKKNYKNGKPLEWNVQFYLLQVSTALFHSLYQDLFPFFSFTHVLVQSKRQPCECIAVEIKFTKKQTNYRRSLSASSLSHLTVPYTRYFRSKRMFLFTNRECSKYIAWPRRPLRLSIKSGLMQQRLRQKRRNPILLRWLYAV